jgi:hypothetical protein
MTPDKPGARGLYKTLREVREEFLEDIEVPFALGV